jgi:serine/alanine racemase
MKKELALVDLAKLFFSYCVATIHIYLFYDISNSLNSVLKVFVWRLAVPFFFIVSGYFLGQKLKAGSAPGKIAKQYAVRLGIPYVFWSLMNIAFAFVVNKNYNVVQLIKNLKILLLGYPLGALWFLYTLIVGVIFVCFMEKYFGGIKKPLLILLAFVYAFGLLFNSYSGIFRLFSDKDVYKNLFEISRNAFYVGIPFVSIGYSFGKNGLPKYLSVTKNNILGICLGYLLLICEVLIILKLPKRAGGAEFYLAFLIIVPNLLCLLVRGSEKYPLHKMNAYRLRIYSSTIYYSHFLVYSILYSLFSASSILYFILVIGITTLLGETFYRSRNKFIARIR